VQNDSISKTGFRDSNQLIAKPTNQLSEIIHFQFVYLFVRTSPSASSCVFKFNAPPPVCFMFRVPTPVNDLLQAEARKAAVAGLGVGAVPTMELMAKL
jgi:hypothetical protein